MTKRAVVISAIIIISLIIIGYTFISEPETSTIKFQFSIEETDNAIDGEVFVNNISLGSTEKGVIAIPRQSNISQFVFKTNYNGRNHEFLYDVNESDLSDDINFVISEDELNDVSIIMYENSTNCPLSGDIYVYDGNWIGQSKQGVFTLSKEEFDNIKSNSTNWFIAGQTDACFGKNSGLPFLDDITIPAYSYEQDKFFVNLSFNPRSPTRYWEMQGFIRPNETKSYLETELRRYFTDDPINNLDNIAKYTQFTYMSDNGQFQQLDYWQTPAEVLSHRLGDCEDWAIATLSLMRAYDNSIKCYAALWATHVSIICYLDNTFYIYDQDKVKFLRKLNSKNNDTITQQENKKAVREMLSAYFEEYGIHPNEGLIQALFNERDLVTFNTNEDFVTWALTMIQNKS
jgi:hypothetical protein